MVQILNTTFLWNIFKQHPITDHKKMILNCLDYPGEETLSLSEAQQ